MAKVTDKGILPPDDEAYRQITVTCFEKMKRPLIYFAHPQNSYNTELEKRLLYKIVFFFSFDYLVENPNHPHHQAKCKRLKEAGLNVMEYFFDQILPPCSTCICLAFRDGKFGAGVYGEAEFFAKRGDKIYVISPEGEIKEAKFEDMEGLTVEETRERIKTAY